MEDLITYSIFLRSLTPPRIYKWFNTCYLFNYIILYRHETIISEPSEYPKILINWLGNNLTNIYAKNLPNKIAHSVAGINGLLLNLLYSYFFIPSAFNMSIHDLPINFIKFVMQSLVHCTAYISLSGIKLVSYCQWDFLFISSDRKPLIQIFTIFLRSFLS